MSDARISFDNTYARLPQRFFSRISPTPVAAPRLIRVNGRLAERLGIDREWLAGGEALEVFAGNRVPANAEPIATAYAGHQFGGFVPQLGDGRAILLGEVIDCEGIRRDIQLKGAGPTPYSRSGDGRAAIGPVLREYLVSEAMAALGIPTTRALAAVTTGEPVQRETALPGAVLTRVAASHLRVGTFEFFANRDDGEGVRLLADYVISRHYPAAAAAERPYRALLDQIIAGQAELIARWMLVGFIHGVMNTDNMSIAGETIDYGPCAFLDEYKSDAVFSAIDRQGRYAYSNQPAIGQWNLTRLAECLLPLLSADEETAVADATEALQAYGPAFQAAYHSGLLRKIGIDTAMEGDVGLARGFLDAMQAGRADFTNTFRRLADAAGGEEGDDAVRDEFATPCGYDQWLPRWRQRLALEVRAPAAIRAAMRAVNPAYIPRNHRIEAVIRAAIDHGRFEPFEELLQVLSAPYDDQPCFVSYANPPQDHERVRRTFCGT
jgi:serine/tyrosine/threonine adenylyltransferase